MMNTNDIVKRSGLLNYYSGCDMFPTYRIAISKEFDTRQFYDAYSYAVIMACREYFNITYNDLIRLYELCFGKGSAHFRDFDFKFIYTSDFMPDFTSINAKKIADMMDGINYDITDKVSLAADVHKRIVSLHPFRNGNGRMARLCMNSTLLRFGYHPLFVTQDWRHEYCSSQDIDRKFSGNTFNALIKLKVIENERLHRRMEIGI